MLRGVGRVHSQYNTRLVPRTRSLLYSALALGKSRPPLCLETPPVSPRAPGPWALPDARGQFPSGMLDVINAFSSASKRDATSIISHVNASFKFRRYIRRRESARRLAQFLASTSRPSRAHSVMSLAHALGCRFKPNHFESVVHQLSLGEHWSLIPPLVSLARDQCAKTTARLLNWKIRALIECHRFARLDHVLGEFTRENVLPTRRTFHLLVSGHLRNRDLVSAKRNLQLMEQAGFPVDPSTHALIVTAYRSLGLDHQVHARALDALPHVDVRSSTRILNSIIQHFLDVGDESSAMEYINRMITPVREIAHQPRGTTTGADGALPSSSGTFTSSPRTSSLIHPDVATFTILIRYLNGQGQFHRIHNVLNRMLESGVKPDAGVVAALIRTYSLSSRDDMAMGLLASMLKSDADARSVLALLSVKGIPILPISVKDIPLNVQIFNAALSRVMQIRGLSGARSIIRIMQSNGIQSNAATTEVFLDYLDRMAQIETCRLTQVLRRISRKAHSPTIRHLNIILRNALRREKYKLHGCGWNNTAAKFSSTRRRAIASQDNNVILNSEDFDPSDTRHDSHDGFCIRRTILALSRKGIKSDRATFAMWLKHEGIVDPILGTAKSVFRHMVHRGMHPNRYHFTTLMDGFMRAGDTQAAEQVMRSAKAAGFEPDVVMWTVLISGYGRKGEPGLAMRTFRTMVAAGVIPDVPAIDALAHAYFAAGAYSVARKVLLELWPRVKPFPSELKHASLRQLAQTFRQSEDSAATWQKPQGRSFNRKLRGVLQDWK